MTNESQPVSDVAARPPMEEEAIAEFFRALFGDEYDGSEEWDAHHHEMDRLIGRVRADERAQVADSYSPSVAAVNALARARALVIHAWGEAATPGVAMVTVRMEDRPRVSREVVVGDLTEARNQIDAAIAAVRAPTGVADSYKALVEAVRKQHDSEHWVDTNSGGVTLWPWDTCTDAVCAAARAIGSREANRG